MADMPNDLLLAGIYSMMWKNPALQAKHPILFQYSQQWYEANKSSGMIQFLVSTIK